MRAATFTCERCSATFEHPHAEECETKGGICALLFDAGWRSLWSFELHTYAWRCPAHPPARGESFSDRAGFTEHEMRGIAAAFGRG